MLFKDELSQLLAAQQQGFSVLGDLRGAATPVRWRSQVALEDLQTTHRRLAVLDAASHRASRFYCFPCVPHLL